MKYIDWYYEKTAKGKGRKQFEIKKEGYREWKDLVTGTCYCISNQDYEKIWQAGKERLGKFLKAGNLEEIERMFYGHSGMETVDLFADLPYFTNTGNVIEKCVRMRDYVCFRTACLYALRYPMIQNASDLEKEKKQIRMQGFTWRLADGAEECPHLEQIEQMFRGGKDIAAATAKADLVKGGLIKIKQYYLETNKIPEIRGASLLLEKVNTEKMGELIRKEHIRECLIYAGGGKMMGIFPEGKGDQIRRKIERMIEEETLTAQFNFCSRSYALQQLISDYKKVNDEMELALEERQGLRWDFRLEPQGNSVFLEESFKKQGYEQREETKKELCTSCRIRHAAVAFLRGEEEERLCPGCLRKREEGGIEAKRSRQDDYKRFILSNYENAVFNGEAYHNKLEELAENGFIGIIYGDANSMSSHISSFTSFMQMRYFSEVTSDRVREIVYKAIYENLKDSLRFEVIAVGGDDIFIIVSGNKAYDIACTIGKKFDEKFRNRSDGEYQITMSMGVCITHHNLPVQYSFAIAQKLLKTAKQKAWQEREKGKAKGTIDWMVIENEMPGGADLAFQRRGSADKPEKTLRPYTWKQADAVKKFIKKLKAEKSFAFQLRQSWYKHTKEEAELFYEYQMSRKTEAECADILCGLKRLAGEFESELNHHNLVCGEKVYSPWLDAVELWEYTGDEK